MTLVSDKEYPKPRWKLSKDIMRFAGTLPDESAEALRKFEQETDQVYEMSE
jgi:hypothetical protein